MDKFKASQAANRRNPKAPIKLPMCMACSPRSRDEMKCVMCNKVKALDFFSKAQRKKPDDAEKQDREADHDKEVQEVEIMQDLKRKELGLATTNTYSASTVPSRLEASRLSQARSERYETDTNPGSWDWNDGNNDEISLNGSAMSETFSRGTRQTTNSGWDNFRVDDRMRNYSSAGSRDSQRFAKSKAERPTVEEKALASLERENRRAREDEENLELEVSDRDDEDSDDPY
ncbi:hypothetical protein LTS08_007770 [Lithohypha guttulata]|uniref:uncharacterized protein n=1 Tax=Lithohypha guttulata TaxID=1690604 RepID=UPI002DDE13C3|nr:hypothetical protein LTR51_007422 [Lithohypha guttulata]KAK5096164.1 hypothetical protein LTS08_007770 [Lithohypha guttulata]